jgi:ABC-2 type transport system ATP-binding protein
VAPARIDELADRLDLDLGRPIGELSKGNRQKVGLVQAFMNEPDLLILDEPTTGLDPLIQHTFQEMVREVAAEGRTVFLSSHIIDEIDRACDGVAIIREGFLVTVETIEALRARSLRQVRITFDEDVEPARFLALPEVQDVGGDAQNLDIRTSGDIDAIVKLAAEHHVVDLVSEQADLEDIFLAYYAGEDTSAERAEGTGRGNPAP